MKIAILGGGIAGLTAAYYLAKSDQSVTLYEKEEALGGLAAGFRVDGWEWPLERAYHHLFSNDYDILSFAKDIQYDDIFFTSPITSSLVYKDDTFSLFPFDTPVDFFSYPYLTVQDKLRTAAVIAFLKASPFLQMYEHTSSEEFLKKYMGGNVWNELWSELFRKKFGKYAENIAAAFIWARIKKRTKKLGYMKGGFQSFIDYAGNAAAECGAKIKMGEAVETIEVRRGKFAINGELFDTVLSTLPTPLLSRLGTKIFPQPYIEGFAKLKYLHATNLIVASKKPLIRESYWANVLAPELPIMVLVAHTNMIPPKHYDGEHILYVGNYVDKESALLTFDAKQALNHFLPFLKKINPDFTPNPDRIFYFKGPFAQPIYDEDFLKYKPELISPIKNFYVANLDMAYPYDRGTNYAVALGKQANSAILSSGA